MFSRAMLMVVGIGVGFVARAQQPASTPPVLLRDAHLIDGTGAPARDHVSLLLRNGHIEKIGGAEITVATGANAKLLHLADRGTIAVGNCADLLVVDADPLVDIRNTRIAAVYHDGGSIAELPGR